MKISLPKLLLHFEGLGVLVGACVLYAHLGYSWVRFSIFILAPDVALLGFLVNNKIGAIAYNSVHTYVAPLALAGLLFATKQPEWFWIPLIWTAHIGMDRLCGYGLKYKVNPKQTHLHKV